MKRSVAILLVLAFLAGCSVTGISSSSDSSSASVSSVPEFLSSVSSPSMIHQPTLSSDASTVSGETDIKCGDFLYHLDADGNAIVTAWLGSGKILTLHGTLDGHTVTSYAINSEKSKPFFQLEKIILGPDVSVFPSGLIWNDSLPSFEVDSQNRYLAVADGILFNKDMTVLYVFPRNRTGSYTVPESVKEISEEAFYDSALVEITLPEGLERIGRLAFSFSKLKTIEVPKTVRYVGNGAFNDCYDLTDIYVPNGNIEMPDGFSVLYSTKIHTSAGSALHKYAYDNYILVDTENNLFFSDPYVYTEKTVDSALLPKIAANPCTADAALWLCRNTVGEYREEDLFSDVQSTADCYKGLESGKYDTILVPKIDGLLKSPEKYEFVKFADDALVVCTALKSERKDISSQNVVDLYLNGKTVYWDEGKTQRIVPYMTSAMRNLFPLLKYDASGYNENAIRSRVVSEIDGVSLFHRGGIHAMFFDRTLTVDGKAYTDSDYPFKVVYYAVFLKSQPKDGLVRKAVNYLTSEKGQLDCVWETLIGIKGDPGWM